MNTYGIEAIENTKLSYKENPNLFTVECFEIPEYTSLCPRSGYPDFGSIKIVYVPDKKIIEEISLKLYINKFRSFRGGHETTINKLLENIVTLIQPKYIMIFGNFSIRGNIKTISIGEHWSLLLKEKEKEKIQRFVEPYIKSFFNKVKIKIDKEF